MPKKEIKEKIICDYPNCPVHNPKKQFLKEKEKIEDLVEYNGLWYKKGEGNNCDKFTMVDLKELIAQQKAKVIDRAIDETKKHGRYMSKEDLIKVIEAKTKI